MSSITVISNGDENAQVATATLSVHDENYNTIATVKAIGVSKRDPSDRVDVQLGKDLAEARAIRQLGRKLLADANRRVRAAAEAQAKQAAAVEERKARKSPDRLRDINELRSILRNIVKGNPDRTNPRNPEGGCVYFTPEGERCLIGELAHVLGWELPPQTSIANAEQVAGRLNWPVTPEARSWLNYVQSAADARDYGWDDTPKTRNWGHPKILAAIESA